MDDTEDQNGAAAPEPEGPGTVVAPPPSTATDEEAQLQALRPSVNAALGTPPAPTPPPAPVQPVVEKGTLGKLWDFVKPLGDLKQDTKDVIGGVARGANEISNVATDVAKGALEHADPTGEAARMVGGDKAQKSYLDWQQSQTSKTNPIQFSEDSLNRTLGPNPGGIHGFVQGIAQFSVGAALVPEGEGVGLVGKALKFGAAQAIAFAPHAERLSNLIQSGPDFIKNPVTEFLQSKDTDSDAIGRVKNAVEGTLTGAAFEAFIGGVKFLKAKAMGDVEGMESAFRDVKAAPKAAEKDVVTVVPKEDGTFDVTPTRSLMERVRRKVATAVAPEIVDDLRSANRMLDTDQMTGAGSSRAFQKALPAIEADPNMHIALFDANNFGKVNKGPLGMAGGDQAIKDIHDSIKSAAREFGAENRVFRTNARGDEFAVAAPKDVVDNIRARAEEIYGDKDYAGTTVSISGHTGGTLAEADGGLQAAKTARKAGGAIKAPAGDAVNYGTEAEAQQAAATLQYANDHAFTSHDTPTLPAAFSARLKEVGPDPRDMADHMAQSGINFKYIHTAPEAIERIKALADVLPVEKPVQGEQSIIDQSQEVFRDMTPEQINERGKIIFGDTEKLPAQIVAMKVHLFQQANGPLRVLLRNADAAPENAFVQDQLAQGLQSLHEFHQFYRGTSSATGRALQAHQIPIVGGEEIEGAVAEATAARAQAMGGTVVADGAEEVAPEGSPSIIAGKTYSELRAMTRMAFLADGDPAAQLAAINGPKTAIPPGVTQSTWNSVQQAYRMAAMLANAHVLAKKGFADIINVLVRPMEYWLGGKGTGNPALAQFGSDLLIGRWQDSKDAMKVAGKALMEGTNILSPGHSVMDPGTEAGAKGAMNTLFRAATRLIVGQDELAKQMNYRAFIRAKILRAARAEGVTDAGELAQRIEDGMPFAFDQNGAGVDKQAVQYAREGTFSQDLNSGGYADLWGGWNDGGGAGKAMQDAAAKDPSGVVRLVVPFVRTSVNIERNLWEHTPILNHFNAQFKADIAAGGDRAAIAHAKTAVGVATYGIAATLALSKVITGGGPRDPALKALWLDSHQPYSIRVPGSKKWMSYGAANPIMTPFGIVADLVHMSGDMEGHDFLDKASMVMASIAANISRESFNKGIAAFTNAAASGDEKMVRKFLDATAMSYMPSSLSQMNPDNTFREARDEVEMAMERIPGFSSKLEPRRNLFGEIVMKPPGFGVRVFNPFTVSAPMPETVSDELIQLGRGFDMPPRFAPGTQNVDLADRDRYVRPKPYDQRQSPYDRMLELMGKPEDGTPPLRDAMIAMVNSDDYKAASGGGAYAPGGVKYILAAAIMAEYQEKSMGQVLKEYPKLATDMGYSATLQGKSLVSGKAGEDSVVAQYDTLFSAAPKAKLPKR